jgi:phage baseplate assembly protein W
MVVTLDGENVTIVSGNEHSLKIVVPDIPNKIEGMSELLIYDIEGNVLSNPAKVYYDASATKRNKVFANPARTGADDEWLSRSAVYNRDLGFNNFAEITDENSLIQNIYNILLTRKGERLFNPDFGTTIEERVFSIMNEDDETSILQECFTAINEYEPRVSVDYEESKVDIDYDANTIRIIIAVVLPNGNSEYIVLPFKSRGKLVK